MSRPVYEATLHDGDVVTTRSKQPVTHCWFGEYWLDGVRYSRVGWSTSADQAYREVCNYLGNHEGRRDIVHATRIDK
jgi:hypothetical protein